MKFLAILLTSSICFSSAFCADGESKKDSRNLLVSKDKQAALPDTFYRQKTFMQAQKITTVVQSIVNTQKQKGSIMSGEVIQFGDNAPIAPKQKTAPNGYINQPSTDCTRQGLMLTVDDAGNHYVASVWGLSQITKNMVYKDAGWEEPSSRFDKDIIRAFDLRDSSGKKPTLLTSGILRYFFIQKIEGLGIQPAALGTSDYVPADRTAAWEKTKKEVLAQSETEEIVEIVYV